MYSFLLCSQQEVHCLWATTLPTLTVYFRSHLSMTFFIDRKNDNKSDFDRISDFLLFNLISIYQRIGYLLLSPLIA